MRTISICCPKAATLIKAHSSEVRQMTCDVCKRDVGSAQKYTTYYLPKQRIQVRVCTSCLVKGINNVFCIVSENPAEADGSTLVVKEPELVFHMDDWEEIPGYQDFRDTAMRCGWRTTVNPKFGTEFELIVEHYHKAHQCYWFTASGRWARDVTVPPLECFRRSCVNIAENYGMWHYRNS